MILWLLFGNLDFCVDEFMVFPDFAMKLFDFRNELLIEFIVVANVLFAEICHFFSQFANIDPKSLSLIHI